MNITNCILVRYGQGGNNTCASRVALSSTFCCIQLFGQWIKTLPENSVILDMEILHVFRLQAVWIYNLDICTFSVSMVAKREK